MKRTIEIAFTTDSQYTQAALQANAPNGVSFASVSPVSNLKFDMAVNFDVKIVIDLSQITIYAFALWLVSRAAIMKAKATINLDGNQISEDEVAAVKLISNKIKEQQSDEQRQSGPPNP